MRSLKPSLTIAILSTLLLNQAAEARLMYHLKDLESLDDPKKSGYGNQSNGLGINDSGLVVGWTHVNRPETKTAIDHAFKTVDNYSLFDLGTFENDMLFSYSTATAINSDGLIVGSSTLAGHFHAFLFDAEGMHNLATLDPASDSTSYAYDINDAGQVTGSTTPKLPPETQNAFFYLQHAFLTSLNGPMIDLGTLPGTNPDQNSSYGLAINATGRVTGYANTSQGKDHAFITDANGQNMQDIDANNTGYSKGLAINNAGRVVGYIEQSLDGGENYQQHAFVTDDNGANLHLLQQLENIESWATGINDHNEIIGNSSQGAFLIDAAGNLLHLASRLAADSSACQLHQVNAINNNGAITGTCSHSKNIHAMVLTPDEIPAADKGHGDSVKLSESQKDSVKCDKAKHCTQLTTGSYSLSLKLSADTLSDSSIDLDKLTASTPIDITLGKYRFTGSLSTAVADKKTVQPPDKLPANWTTSHDECVKPAANPSCSHWKAVIDDTVKISSDKKRALIVTIKGKKSVVDGKNVGQQAFAELCQNNAPDSSQLTPNGEIAIADKRLAIPLKVKCGLKQSSKTADSGPVTLNNISIKASLGD